MGQGLDPFLNDWSKKKVQGCGSYLTKYGLTVIALHHKAEAASLAQQASHPMAKLAPGRQLAVQGLLPQPCDATQSL